MVSRYIGDKIRDDFFNNMNDNTLCIKYKISHKELMQLYKTVKFRNRIINNIKWKRCKNCDVWKEISYYPSGGMKTYKSNCKICYNLKYRNNWLLGNIDKDTAKKRNKKYRDKQEPGYLYLQKKTKLKQEGKWKEFIQQQRVFQQKYRDKKRQEKINLLRDKQNIGLLENN